MALTLTSSLSIEMVWSQIDTQESNARLSDNGSIAYNTGFLPGTGIFQNNLVWHDIRTIPSGSGSEQLDLTSLQRELFGSSYNVSFSGGHIKAFVVKNKAAATGSGGSITGRDLIIKTTGANSWSEPFGGATGIRIKPQAPYVIVDRTYGYSVNSSNRLIDMVDAANQGLTYEIGIIGVNV